MTRIVKQLKRFCIELAYPNLAKRLECGGSPPLWDKTNPGEIVCPAREYARPTSGNSNFQMPIVAGRHGQFSIDVAALT